MPQRLDKCQEEENTRGSRESEKAIRSGLNQELLRPDPSKLSLEAIKEKRIKCPERERIRGGKKRC